MAKKKKDKKVFTIRVTMTVKKDYTVVGKDYDEALEKLQEAGIVNSTCEGHHEDYNEDYDEVKQEDYEPGTDVDVE